MSSLLAGGQVGQMLRQPQKYRDVRQVFVTSAAVVLSLTGLAKIWAATGVSRLLAAVDPVFGVTFRKVMMGAGIVEVAIALICLAAVFRPKWMPLSIGLVAWLATSFIAYRYGLMAIGWSQPCNCLGSLTARIGIPASVADIAMKCLAWYLVVGSYTLLVIIRRGVRTPLGGVHESGDC